MLTSLYINDIKVKVEKNSTVLQACNSLNLEIPKFCFQNNLEIAGNCRMCLVEVKNSIKPVASCALPVSEGLRVYTDTPLVKKAREAVLEFLLINHPLDCPICDQGGECDLQDQTMVYGSDRSRFFELKRAVEDKNCGPFIKTVMTRCIHCTRCVRFANEVCGIDGLGTTGRGNTIEIGFYLEKMFKSEFSGNVIDLCPVGALTNKPFAFRARSWELKNRDSIDILDSMGSNIKVNVFNNEIVRILPRKNDNINMEWISNQTRFFFDSLKYQRIEKPLKRKNGKLISINWKEVLDILNDKINTIDSSNVKVKVGNFIDLKSLFLLKKNLNLIGKSDVEFTTKQNNLNITNKLLSENFLTVDLLDLDEIDNCLLIGCNPRKEVSILNLHLRKRFRKGNFSVYNIGEKLDLTFPTINLGNSNKTLLSIIEGKHFICKNIIKSNKTLVIFGQKFLNNKENSNIASFFKENDISKKICFSTLYKESGFLNFLELGFNQSRQIQNEKFVYLYNTDIKFSKKTNSFLMYQGHHFTSDAQQADLILPSVSYLEKNSIFINIQGKIQKVKKSLKNKTDISDINFFKNLYIFLNKKNNSKYIYKQNSLLNIFPYLKNNDVCSNHNLFRYNLNKFNVSLNNIQPLIYNESDVNILEKYSKTLKNAYNIINKNTNFT